MCIVTEVSHTWVQVPAWLEQDRRSAVEAALGREASRKAVAADGCGCVPLSGDVTQLAAWKAAMWPAVDHECLNQELGLLSRLAHAVLGEVTGVGAGEGAGGGGVGGVGAEGERVLDGDGARKFVEDVKAYIERNLADTSRCVCMCCVCVCVCVCVRACVHA